MNALFATLVRLVDRDGSAALVTVCATHGSAPREAGARLIVARGGAISGTIGGGRLEHEAIQRAVALMATGARRHRTDAHGPWAVVGPVLRR